MSNIKKYCAIITVDQVLMPVSHQDNKSINQLGIFQTQRKKERKKGEGVSQKSRKFGEGGAPLTAQ